MQERIAALETGAMGDKVRGSAECRWALWAWVSDMPLELVAAGDLLDQGLSERQQGNWRAIEVMPVQGSNISWVILFVTFGA